MSSPVEFLVELASRQRAAYLYYRKGATSAALKKRVVEAYKFTQGKQDMMVRCFQTEPEEGWRFFMLHKIERVEDSGRSFEPRAKITLDTGVIADDYGVSDAWSDPVQEYRNMVCAALADGVVTPFEKALLGQFKSDNKLTLDQVRYVHGSIFHRCLGAILEDGVIDNAELKELAWLQSVFHELGWSVGD